jgi:hypothetical protein
VPVIVGSSVNSLQLARALFEQCICAQAIVYPAVEESGARLRFFVHATHTPEQIDQAVFTLANELGRIQPSYFETARSGNSDGVLRREGASLEFH